ncbi:MAG: hypothetical protein RMZ41_019385 [Nostoc sp. DedVER02]|uniref:hypothetical protein n=1 Tax=unclassified Nostoc TaxID=2593658 RepID=UPI002AD4CCE9|nr:MULTISPECIES: hypothetical protein [unclassified Nostoc]MDZ7988918.1 hypothetical protein [Nostoc sp. DedVER02]MDZ8114712.1 hypothetical protein [Nostoc sp. DedVER01b]
MVTSSLPTALLEAILNQEDTTRYHLSQQAQGSRQFHSDGTTRLCAAGVVGFWFSPVCLAAS